MLWALALLLPHCALPALSFVAFPPALPKPPGPAAALCGAAAPACCLPRLRFTTAVGGRAGLRIAAAAPGSPQDGRGGTGGADGAPALEEFHTKAEQLLAAAGGQLDSLAFGRKWKKAFPRDSLDRYKGQGFSTVAQMLAQSPRFAVEDREGASAKTFSLAAPETDRPALTPSSGKDVETRQSNRGYSFSVVEPPKRGTGTSTRNLRPPSASDSAASAAGAGAPPQAEAAEASGASKLIDIWSQAAALSDAEEGLQEQAAVSLIRNAGGRANAVHYTRLISEHARAAARGDRSALNRAFQVLDDMAEDGVEPNKITFTALITACAKAAGAGVGAFALDRGMMLLERMQELGLETDIVTFNALLDACAKAAALPSSESMSALEKGFALLDRMEKTGPCPNYITYNTLVHACAKAAAFPSQGPACLDRALQLLERMEAAQEKPQVMTYNALVDACARAGKGREGIKVGLSLLSRMESAGLQPDAITYNSLINACARAASSDTTAFQSALSVLDLMERGGISPNVVTFNSLATIIARAAQAGDICDPCAASSQGQQVLGMLLSAKLSPTVVTLNALLSAVVSAGISGAERSDEEVEELLDMLLQLGVKPNEVTFNHVLESIQHAEWLELQGLQGLAEDAAGSQAEDATGSLGRQGVKGGGRGGGRGTRWVRGEPQVDDLLEALEIFETVGGIEKQILGNVLDLVQRSDERVLALLPLLRLLVSLGARPEQPLFHSLLNRCMSFGGDGLGEAIALVDMMDQVGFEFTDQTEAIVERIRQAHEDDPALAGLEAWDVVTPEIRGTPDEDAADDSWIELREMTRETERVFLKHASVASSLDTLPDYDVWEEGEAWSPDKRDLSDSE
jgi:pentatricopeptide repeat protein